MTRQEILKKVRRIVAETLFIEESDVYEEDSLQSDLEMDSLDKVLLFETIQGAFNIDISDIEALCIETIEEVVDKVAEKLAN